jgi:hypothetical protein
MKAESFDDLGNRMKKYEMAEAGRKTLGYFLPSSHPSEK